ncbi:hypothetical protein AAVH_28597 [Aphelenchoides avenae]|nr:hypothetical protein AAVH_28597 [Aphelenchus avenae]
MSLARCEVVFEGISESDCEQVGKLIDREKGDTLPTLEALTRVYFPPLTIAEHTGLKAFFHYLDGQRICKRAISCGADYECIVRHLLQGIGESAFSTPGLNMATYRYCTRCKALRPAARLTALSAIVKGKLEKSSRNACTLFYTAEECAEEFNDWFNSHYENLVDYVTASTACEDLKLCKAP